MIYSCGACELQLEDWKPTKQTAKRGDHGGEHGSNLRGQALPYRRYRRGHGDHLGDRNAGSNKGKNLPLGGHDRGHVDIDHRRDQGDYGKYGRFRGQRNYHGGHSGGQNVYRGHNVVGSGDNLNIQADYRGQNLAF